MATITSNIEDTIYTWTSDDIRDGQINSMKKSVIGNPIIGFAGWKGLTTFNGEYIWNDGRNIYYSDGSSSQYMLNIGTSTWTPKVWNGYNAIHTSTIWTNGANIYHSYGNNQYVLDKSTSTWNPMTWTGYTGFTGGNIWTDLVNIYYSVSTNHYVLSPSGGAWFSKSGNIDKLCQLLQS